MNSVLTWAADNVLLSFLVAAIAFWYILTLVAFLQGRAVSLWPPQIGGRPLGRKTGPSGGPGTTGSGNSPVFEAIRNRKSVRAYTQAPIEPEKLERILEAARLAPSASNRQEWRYVVVTDRKLVASISRASCIGSFVSNPHTIIVACAVTNLHTMQCGQLSYPIDVAISLDHLSLAAVELGLGTCWIGMFDEKQVKNVLGIPWKTRVVALMTVGYPADPTPVEKKRKQYSEIVMPDRWKA